AQNVSMLLEWALPVLLRSISIDNLLLVLGCAITENQIVFVCPDITRLSASVVSILLLLRPLSWPYPIIVTLPVHLHVYLESPVPVILGVTSLPADHEIPPGQTIVDISDPGALVISGGGGGVISGGGISGGGGGGGGGGRG
ncbi:hypothetical protein ScalyP_jg410, partial [Parmales sp. scaly parma]